MDIYFLQGKVQPKPEEKPDLFKAIFLSSSEDSESDSEDDDTPQTNKSLESKTNSKENLVTPRNLSPPRGIFANLDLDALNARSSEKKEENISSTKGNTSESHHSSMIVDKQGDDLMYGPRLPTALPKTSLPSSSDTFHSHQIGERALWVERKVKSEKYVSVATSSDSDDSSVSSGDKKKSSKKKKQKKEKKKKKDKKHKKHKSKHKKKC